MELREYVQVFKRRRVLIGSTATAVLFAALLLSFLQTPQYEATARVLIEPDQSLFGGSAASVASGVVQTELEILQSQAVRDAVTKKLGKVAYISTTQVAGTAVIEVASRNTTPAEAATVANAYVAAYVDYRKTQSIGDLATASQQLQAKVADLQKQIDAVSVQLANTPICAGVTPPPNCGQRDPLQQDRDALLNQIIPLKQKLTQIELDGSASTGGPRVVTPATVPSVAVEPRPIRNGLMGLFAGLVLGTAVGFVLDHLDDSIKTKDDVERATRGLPVLGLIPAVPVGKNKDEPLVVSQTDAGSPAAEAYRALRTSINFLSIEKAVRTIQITSASASEGKTTTTANLAIAMARTGQRVVVVSCDLRRPRVHTLFGLSNDVGFTSVLLGESSLSLALQRVPGEERLVVLASGPNPPNPSELLASTRARQILAVVASNADIVLIDCPPVLPVTDAATLAPLVDATLLVATAGATIGKDLTRALELLRQVNAPLIGTLLNGVTSEGAYGYIAEYNERNGNGSSTIGTLSRRQIRKPDRASRN